MTTIKKLKKEIKKLDRLMLLSDRDFKKYFELGEKEKTDKYDEKIVTAGSQFNIFGMRRRALQIKLSTLEKKQKEVNGIIDEDIDNQEQMKKKHSNNEEYLKSINWRLIGLRRFKSKINKIFEGE